MSFCVSMPCHISPISDNPGRSYELGLIDYRDGSRVPWQRMVSYLESLFWWNGQNLLCTSQTAILSTYINIRLRYNYFQFRKINVGHIGIRLPFDLNPIAAFGISWRIDVPTSIEIGPMSAELSCHIDFQDGGRCGAHWVTLVSLQRSKSIGKPNFVGITQSTVEI